MSDEPPTLAQYGRALADAARWKRAYEDCGERMLVLVNERDDLKRQVDELELRIARLEGQ